MKLELRNITKRFGTLVANDHISLTVEPGEIHCLLGENGAGKSTLMNVLYGLYQADEGEVLLDGVVQHFAGPGDAMAAGIGMVHQHFMLIPVFTVAENVMLGHEKTLSGGRLDLDAARDRVSEIAAQFGFHVDPDSVIEDLPVGVQQRVEIIKALSRDAELATMMVGRAVELTVHKDEPTISESVLEVTGLEVRDARGTVLVDDVSFTVRGGEVLVVAGVQGNGQTELVEALVGLQRHTSGSVTLDGTELLGLTVRQILDTGVGFVPADRSTDGLVGDFTVAENLMLDRTSGPA